MKWTLGGLSSSFGCHQGFGVKSFLGDITMCKIVGILGMVGLLAGFASISFAADPTAKKDKKADATANQASQLAEDIFNKADKHHHGYLNKYEFKTANSNMVSAINQMAADKLLGKGKPPADASTTAANFKLTFENADTDHDKKLTLAEFTDYVARAIVVADQDYRAAKAAASPKGRY
jgi:Ca2+-binding EF-hand superfamily protein